jgi:predicted phage tail protein
MEITVPLRCTGGACDAVVNLLIYEGSLWYTHGKLLTTYTQDVSFLQGEEKDVIFEDTMVQTGESRRDAGVQVVVEDQVVASREFDDIYSVDTGGSGGLTGSMTSMMGMLMMVMMLGSLVPMLSGQAGSEGEEA